MNRMKRNAVTITILMILALSGQAQTALGSLARGIGSSMAFKSALGKIEEKNNRFFYKQSKGYYIFNGSDSDLDGDNKSYMDVVLEDGGNILLVQVFTYQLSSKEFVLSETIHGSDRSFRKKYQKIDGDVYVAQENLSEGYCPEERVSYLLYNAQRGVYFHSFYYRDNSGVANGMGLYTASKKQMPSEEDMAKTADYTKSFGKQLVIAAKAFNDRLNQLKRDKINALPDEGITSDFHKSHISQVVFANAINEKAKGSTQSFKNRFTLDEPIQLLFFAGKGLNKFISTSEDGAPLENINDKRQSTFDMIVLSEGRELARSAIQVSHTPATFKTSGTATLVSAKASDLSNAWIKSTFPEELTSDMRVTILIKTKGEQPEQVASGEFTYTGKKGAKMPYGTSCASEDYNQDVKRMKPDLQNRFQNQLNKEVQARGYKLVMFNIISDWESTYFFDKLNVAYVLLTPEGTCVYGTDNYHVGKKDKSLAYFNKLSNGKIFQGITSNCDCPASK